MARFCISGVRFYDGKESPPPPPFLSILARGVSEISEDEDEQRSAGRPML
jgi:hypothetical protein